LSVEEKEDRREKMMYYVTSSPSLFQTFFFYSSFNVVPLLGQICEEKCGVCAQSARENNGRMNGNKNSKKNEDELAKSAHVKQRERKNLDACI
jgi:hypothetical protein